MISTLKNETDEKAGLLMDEESSTQTEKASD
jgi:hypothetical protein